MSDLREFVPFVFAGLEIAKIGGDLLTGRRTDRAAAGAEIVSKLTKIIPVADLRMHLDDFDRAAIDAAADVAEEEKLARENQP